MIDVDPRSIAAMSRFRAAMSELAAATRKDEATVLTAQGKAVATRMVAYTPTPRQVAKGNIKTYAKRVVTKYFWRASTPLLASFWKAPEMKEAIKKKDKAKAQALLQTYTGRLAQVEPWNVSLVFSRMNKRGQVPKNRAKAGNYTIETQQWKKDLRKAQTATLKGKGGWASGWRALGGKPPAQIAVHTDQGSFVDKRKASDPEFLFINTSAWGKRSDEAKRITLSAIGRATQAMLNQMKKAEERRLAKAAAKAK